MKLFLKFAAVGVLAVFGLIIAPFILLKLFGLAVGLIGFVIGCVLFLGAGAVASIGLIFTVSIAALVALAVLSPILVPVALVAGIIVWFARRHARSTPPNACN